MTVEHIKEFLAFTAVTFPQATKNGTLQKLVEETVELTSAETRPQILEECVDCIMCILHIAGQSGFTAEEIESAFKAKLEINKSREWKKNAGANNYSHVDSSEIDELYKDDGEATDRYHR
jgi:phosphoribosyl-ATP pyrophosphohydrolase